MVKFVVSGRVVLGRSERTFKKEVDAPTEKMAREKVYSLLGSHNGVKRSKIVLEKVERHG